MISRQQNPALTYSGFFLVGALGYSQGYHLGGDVHDKAIKRARDNVTSLEEKNGISYQTDIARWDATNIPLRQGSVDVLITDLVK